MKIRKVENIVIDILETKPETRNNDNLLILEFIKRVDQNEKTSFENVMKQTNISFESITRARRSVQHKNPRLKNKDIENVRTEKEAEYFNYYK